ncbi:MAG TPA: EamA family transporter [Nitrososphaeraceae archaeon]|nr:EamA family transporter [Nitrososphaeraceae archaeon]
MVFVYAITISLESIIIEYLTTSFAHFSPIMLSAISITFAGLLLLIVAVCVFKRAKRLLILFSKSWKKVVLASLSLSFGIFTWYDSINKIGASKEVLIAGPLEIVIIVILARAFLRERLSRFQFIGIGIALVGFFMAVVSDTTFTFPNNTQTSITVVSSGLGKSWSLSPVIIGFGDVEAILSAFGFAGGVIFLTKLAIKYSSIEVAGASMFTSGLILAAFMVVGLMSNGTSHAVFSFKEIHFLRQPLVYSVVVVILLFSLLPFVGSLSYSTGLSRIGATLTSIIGSSSILMTVVLQIILKELGISSHLPENIFLAIVGGITGFLGIYVIHFPGHSVWISKKE